MQYKPFSKKQMKTLLWWCDGSPYQERDAVICDGAVRSGKTLCLSLSYVLWAMTQFENSSFALCGKTLGALRRNVITPLLSALSELPIEVSDTVSKNLLTMSYQGRENRFYLFSGKDEGSASLIQGITLSGVMFDEVALMPRSFVEQALARCSVQGSKFFFNCNPEYPSHWFYREWIQKCKEKNALYLHFTMDDNPSLSDEMKRRYRALYSGAFSRRFIDGEWVSVSGAVYPFMDSPEMYRKAPGEPMDEYCVSCDYGTVNPTSMGLWGRRDGIWYRIDEYYYDSRVFHSSRTDEEHYEGLEKLAGERMVKAVIIDPSARSFAEVIRRHKRFEVIPAENSVIDGIRKTFSALKEKKVVICDNCRDAIREFSLYRWDENKNSDTVVKENDHAMDDIRYFVSYLESGTDDGFSAVAAFR